MTNKMALPEETLMARCSLWVVAFLMVAASATAGCRRTPVSNGSVACWWIDGVVLCDVSNKRGAAPLDICWNVDFVCRNGTKVSGTACKVVHPGKTDQARIAPSTLVNGPKCDGADSINVVDVRDSPATTAPP